MHLRTSDQTQGGAARKDGQNGARAVQQYLEQRASFSGLSLEQVRDALDRAGAAYVDKLRWQRLDQAEQTRATEQGLEEFRYGSNAEMLAQIGS